MGFGSASRIGLVGRLLARLNLRFPTLFLLFAGLTLVDLVIPDAVPFVDEIGLALLTALLGLWKARRPRAGRVPAVAPRDRR
jgi:hypothetical protein